MLSLILTGLSVVAFSVATWYGYRAIEVASDGWKIPLAFLASVAGANLAYRIFTFSYRLLTGTGAAALGEWVVWSALVLQFALALAIMVAIAMSYWTTREIAKRV